jgi:hypothetical protein
MQGMRRQSRPPEGVGHLIVVWLLCQTPGLVIGEEQTRTSAPRLVACSSCRAENSIRLAAWEALSRDDAGSG